MATKMPESALLQCRVNKIAEISNVLAECDKVIDDLSERLHWDKKQLLSEVYTVRFIDVNEPN